MGSIIVKGEKGLAHMHAGLFDSLGISQTQLTRESPTKHMRKRRARGGGAGVRRVTHDSCYDHSQRLAIILRTGGRAGGE